MVCDAPYLQNEFGDPHFFYVFNIILTFSTCSQSFKKICTWEILGTDVLKRSGSVTRSIKLAKKLRMSFHLHSFAIYFSLHA